MSEATEGQDAAVDEPQRAAAAQGESWGDAHVSGESRTVNENPNQSDQLQDQLDSFEFDLRGTTIDTYQ